MKQLEQRETNRVPMDIMKEGERIEFEAMFSESKVHALIIIVFFLS